MAATNYTPIQLYRTTTASAVPDAANLVAGELAINTTDGKLYYKTTGGTVQLLSANVTPVANGGTGQTTASAAFNALSPITSVGDIIIGNGSNSSTRLAIGANNYVLTSNGTTASWAAIPANVSSFSAGTTGLTPSTGTTGAVTLAGTLAIANGGTGQTTASAAFNALSPVTSTGDLIIGNGTNSSTRLAIGANGYVLTSNGTTATWSAAGSSGVSSFSAGTTGLTPSTGTTGAVTLAGTLAIANGGTGQTTASAAFNALAPVTSTGDLIVGNGANSSTRLAIGSNGQVLTSNGTTATWAAATSSSTLTISNKTGAYTVVSGDAGTIINCTANSFTVSLTAAATLGSGFNCWIWNTSNTSTHVITIDPNGSETIDGVSTLLLRRGEGTQIVCNGTNWQTGSKKTMRAYAENIGQADSRPIATGDRAISIGAGTTSSGAQSVAIGGGALGSGATASGAQSVAIGGSTGGVASASGGGSVALGYSAATQQNSFAAVIEGDSTYGALAQNAIAINRQAKASGLQSIAIGYSTQANSDNAVALGKNSLAYAANAFAFGNYSRVDQIGKYVYSSGPTVTNARSQYGLTNLYAATTDATATVMTTDGGAATASNQLAFAISGAAFAFTGTVVARQNRTAGTASAAWKIEGLIRYEATAASTTLVASTVTAISNVPGWTLALSADTTNGALAVTATGAVSTNVFWTAIIQSSEINNVV